MIGATVLAVDAGLAYADIAWSRHGVVTGETIARKGIGKNYEPAFDQPLKDGAEFTILSENGDWIFGHFRRHWRRLWLRPGGIRRDESHFW